MFAVERRNQILEKLQDEKKVFVSELSKIFKVSEETIRRDLDKLQKEGFAVKSYGGAIYNEDTNIDMPFNVRKKRNVEGKQKIANIVQQLVNDGDHIILDASTTAVFIAKALKKKKYLTVVTNSVEILIELADLSTWNVISTGGKMREGYLSLFGTSVIDSFKKYNVDKAFISCKGFDVEHGITDSIEDFAEVKKGIIQASNTCVLAVDSSKFDRIAFAKICDINNIDMIVTDKKPVGKWMMFFEQKGIKCLFPGD